ncbi:MAG: UvrD-helicase domain-containing protein, partial [Acidimicrobiales bacterium]
MTRRDGGGGDLGGAPASSVQLLLFEGSEHRPRPEAQVGDQSAPSEPQAEATRAERPPTDPPVDEHARARIATALDETLFAVAAAGSGKTRHLVERVLNVLLTGKARVDQLAVITFTEAAVAELRERIGEELDRVVAATRDADPVVLQRAADALGALDGAAITTLHGFARRILSEFPFDAGLPPTFDVLDEARSLADLDDHWVEAVDALLADDRRARAVQWTLVAGAALGSFRAIVRRMSENWDRLAPTASPTGARSLPRLDPGHVARPLRLALALEACCTDADDGLRAHLAQLRPYLARLQQPGDELQLLRTLLSRRSLAARTKGNAGAWSERKPDLVALLDEAEAARQSTAGSAVGAAMEVVGEALGELAVSSARRRQREGRLQF